MSWQLGAFTVLAAAIAGGFAWYEHSRPDARIVALVGTLAAFAALGRIAFAALPNVKPTTDIVLISGYALGGGPGFAVGAIAGLTSNFFFGQGPWTPWQMAAWGATGLVGAGLARATRRHASRFVLAAVCAVVGYAFAAFQDLGDWVTYSDHSLAQLGVYVGKGTGFDLVHAGGCAAFALALGPALAGSVSRFARRLHVHWEPVADTAVALVLAVLLLGGDLLATSATARAATPTGYLLAAQHADGGFGPDPASPSSAPYSGWAALGLASAGLNPADVSHGGASLLSYIAAGAGGLRDPGSLERTILVIHAAGVSATSVGGQDLLARLERLIRHDGSVSEQVNLTAFAVLALRAAGRSAPPATVSWLVRQQNGDGGFGFATRGAASDVDDTGAALQALAGAGGGPAARARRVAIHFIIAQQNRGGGFPSSPGGDSNAQSTAWAVQGLLAAGVDPATLQRGGRTPYDYLSALIAADGHVAYARGLDQTPVWVTGQVLMALEHRPLPLGPVPRAAPPRAVARPHRHRSRAALARQRSARRPLAHAHRRVRSVAASAALSTRFAAFAGFATAVLLAPVSAG